MAFELDSNIYNKAREMSLAERLGAQKLAAGDEEIKNAKLERAAGYLNMATPENWNAIRQQAISEGLGDQQTIPVAYDKNWVDNVRQAFASRQTNIPSSIQEYSFFNKLSPADQDKYLNVKRAAQVINLGGQKIVRAPTGGVAETYQVTPKPEDMPEFKGAQKDAQNASDLKYEPVIAGEKKAAELDATQSNTIDNQLSEIQNFKNSVVSFKDALSKTSMTGQVGARVGNITSDPGRTELVSAQNELTLRAKGLLGMPSANFSDADRDFITEIAGGKYGSKEGLQRVSERLDKMADEQIQSLKARKQGISSSTSSPTLQTTVPASSSSLKAIKDKYGLQ